MTAAAPSEVYLRSFLSPLAGIMARAEVTDLYVNRPSEVWVETLGGDVERIDLPELSATVLDRLARQIASISHQGISREHPLLSASLPDGSRVQVIAPPATRGPLALAIRKHVAADLTLDDYQRGNAFVATNDERSQAARIRDIDLLVQAGNFTAALRAAVEARCNILVAGGTSTGKTTFLNALIAEIPASQRLIVIEDTPEVTLRHENAIGLLAARTMLGEASVTAEDLLNASLRMRPDRIILGELRGPEAFSFLRAVNTGHPGSMTTIHADSPARATEQLALLVLQTGTRLSREDVQHYVRSTIDLYVQLERVGGRRIVSEIVTRRSPADAEAF